MAEITIALANGRSVPFHVDKDAAGPACFVLGIRKCGSTMLNGVAATLAAMNGRNYVFADNFFQADVREQDYVKDPATAGLLHGGNVYGGFRMMPAAFASHEIFQSGPKILMVRDPRDALTSQYFSNAFSHPMPDSVASQIGSAHEMAWLRQQARQSNIDEAVLKAARSIQIAFLQYADVSRAQGTVLIKYEDFIFRKPDLIHLVAHHFGWAVNDDQVAQILMSADTIPTEEVPTAFIRQVTPGDHRRKLQPGTIEKLDALLEPAMSLFGYA